MKILKYTYIPLALVFALLFGTTAEAATSMVTTTYASADGNTYTIRGQSYTSIEADQVEYEQYTLNNVSNIQEVYTYHLTENFTLNGIDSSKYYSGTFYFRITVTPSISGTQITSWELDNTFVTDGLYMAISYIGNNYCQVYVYLDNFKGKSVNQALNTVKFTAVKKGLPDNTSSAQNFSVSLSTQSADIYGYEGVQNNALTGMIYSALEQGTQADFDAIISLLTTIRNQDYTYYNQIITALGLNGTLHNDNLQIYALLSGLDAHTQNGFAAVQTILDLFPSYRTAVLNYWQQLLEMNAEQSSAAAEMESQAANQESQSANLLSGLGSVTMPSLSSNDLDIMASADGNTKTNFFGLVSIITHNSLITTIILTITTAAIAGFILYGKRG